MTYSWDFGDGGGTSVAANPPVRTYNTNGSYTVTLTVSDGGERTNTASQKIVVGSTPPDVQILTPINDSHYNAGDVISFSATATDAEDGTLPDSAYNWRVIFHHADHIHPYVDSIVGPSGTVSLATNEHNVATTWYEISLTVTDSSGLSTTKSVNIKPNLVTLTFGSNDPNAVYTVDGIPPHRHLQPAGRGRGGSPPGRRITPPDRPPRRAARVQPLVGRARSAARDLDTG